MYPVCPTVRALPTIPTWLCSMMLIASHKLISIWLTAWSTGYKEPGLLWKGEGEQTEQDSHDWFYCKQKQQQSASSRICSSNTSCHKPIRSSLNLCVGQNRNEISQRQHAISCTISTSRLALDDASQSRRFQFLFQTECIIMAPFFFPTIATADFWKTFHRTLVSSDRV